MKKMKMERTPKLIKKIKKTDGKDKRIQVKIRNRQSEIELRQKSERV